MQRKLVRTPDNEGRHRPPPPGRQRTAPRPQQRRHRSAHRRRRSRQGPRRRCLRQESRRRAHPRLATPHPAARPPSTTPRWPPHPPARRPGRAPPRHRRIPHPPRRRPAGPPQRPAARSHRRARQPPRRTRTPPQPGSPASRRHQPLPEREHRMLPTHVQTPWPLTLGTCQDSVLADAADFCGELIWFTHAAATDAYNQPTRVWGHDSLGERVELTADWLRAGRDHVLSSTSPKPSAFRCS